MRQSRRALAVAFVILAVAGCASTTTLDVGYPAAGARRGMLASVPPLRIGVSPIGDHRVDAARIGATPDRDKSITTSRSVPDIVRDALATELGTNGHAIVDAEPIGVSAHIGERDPCRLLHDVAELAGQDEALLALHRGCLDEQHVAARAGHGQACRHARDRGALGRLLEEALPPEGVADLVRADLDRSGHLA